MAAVTGRPLDAVALTRALVDSGVTAVAYETVETTDRRLRAHVQAEYLLSAEQRASFAEVVVLPEP